MSAEGPDGEASADGRYGQVRLLSNDDIRTLLTMSDVVDVLRRAYDELARNMSAYIPLMYLYAPTQSESDGYYRCSAVIGNSAAHQVVATRIKSDVLSWPASQTEEKYAIEPGTFCGLILLFSSRDGRPLGILQDGVIQHMRVGASSALGVELMSRTDSNVLGLLGSGGMARSHLEAIAHVRSLSRVKVFSPNRDHVARFCREMGEILDFEVVAAATAEEAVSGSDIVVSATDSLHPTFEPEWVSPGTHVTCISKRELAPQMYHRATHVVTLGSRALPADASVPGLQRIRGGLSAFIAGSPEEQSRIPRGNSDAPTSYPTYTDLMIAKSFERAERDITLFLTGGTQGVQFSAVGGHVMTVAERRDVGIRLPTDWFVQDVRN